MILNFMPEGKKIEGKLGDNILFIAQKAGIGISSACGGQGTCKKCEIEIDGKVCLACKTQIEESHDITTVKVCHPALTAESNSVVFDKKKLVVLPDDYIGNVKINNEFGKYGVAFDVGTTTVVGMLWDLVDGKLLSVKARTNPQGAFGADVISRIFFCMQEKNNLNIMHSTIIKAINEMLSELCLENSLKENEISRIIAVGNTTMSHLLLCVDPASLSKAPFDPAFYGMIEKKVNELGILADPDSNIVVLPNIAGHVGSDIVAGVLASRLQNKTGINLFIDIGTNGEVVLGNNGSLFTCSTAAGPAFEGASIKYGMRAANGAIERVIWDGITEDLIINTIENFDAIGICGSGLMDIIAVLLDLGVLNEKGKMKNKEDAILAGVLEKIANRIELKEDGLCFLLENNIYITQKDIREVQLAKGAMRAGIEILMVEASVSMEEIDNIFLAGAFGSHIKKESVIRIGLIPNIEREKVASIGNAAGIGACLSLLSENEFEIACSLSKIIKHIELSTYEKFQDFYMNAMYF